MQSIASGYHWRQRVRENSDDVVSGGGQRRMGRGGKEW